MSEKAHIRTIRTVTMARAAATKRFCEVVLSTAAGRLLAERDEALRESDKLRTALAFYADESNWEWDFTDPPAPHPPVMDDRGGHARAALRRP